MPTVRLFFYQVDHVRAFAVASGAKFIVTHNIKDFRGVEVLGVKAITPKELLEGKT
jgi:hypothetical protein